MIKGEVAHRFAGFKKRSGQLKTEKGRAWLAQHLQAPGLVASTHGTTIPNYHHEYSSEKYSFASIFDIARRDSYENLRIYPPSAQKRKINRQKDTRHNVLLNCRQIYEESLHFYYSSTLLPYESSSPAGLE
jgi:hypothetical protein